MLADRRAEGVREARERAELVEVAVREPEAVGAGAARVEEQGAGGAGPEVGAVDPEVVEDRKAVRFAVGSEVEAAHEKALALVDLRAVGLLAADDVEEAVADLDVERNRLGTGDAGRTESRDERGDEEGGAELFASACPYFRSCGERWEPCTATWHVVQFLKRGSVMLWKEGGCEPRVPAESVE